MNIRELSKLIIKQFKKVEANTRIMIENDTDLCMMVEREKQKAIFFEQEL